MMSQEEFDTLIKHNEIMKIALKKVARWIFTRDKQDLEDLKSNTYEIVRGQSSIALHALSQCGEQYKGE